MILTIHMSLCRKSYNSIIREELYRPYSQQKSWITIFCRRRKRRKNYKYYCLHTFHAIPLKTFRIPWSKFVTHIQSWGMYQEYKLSLLGQDQEISIWLLQM